MYEQRVLRFNLLGRFLVRVGDEEIPPAAFGGRLVRTLVRILLTRRGKLVSKDVLIEALWAAVGPRDPVRNLEILVARARRALGDPRLIETGPGGYAFTSSTPCEVDAERFAELGAVGQRELAADRAAEALRAFRDALDWWSGEPLVEDAYAEWAQEPRRELARLYIDVLEGAAKAGLASGLHVAEAVGYAERAAAREPLREASHLLVAQARAASGDAATALTVLSDFRRHLAEELGLDPSPDFDALETDILHGKLPQAPASGTGPLTEPSIPAGAPRLVGRDAELRAILRTTTPLLIVGPPGSGKSRLVSEAAARSSGVVVAVRAFSAERNEAWSLARSLLRECLGLDSAAAHAPNDHSAHALGSVMPEMTELRELKKLSIDRESRRALALEGAVRILEASGAGTIFVDDLQWADATSLTLLELLTERTGLRLIVAYRPEEASFDQTAAEGVTALRRRGARELTLTPLTADAIQSLVSDAELAQAIAEETDGTPLAVLEVLRSLAVANLVFLTSDGRYVVRDPGAARKARELGRAGQRHAIEARVARMPPQARAELERLALVGREVPASLLAHAAGGTQAETLASLDALVMAGLARLGEAGWATAHDVIGETIAGGLPSHVRARRHMEIAEALQIEGADPREIAPHLLGSGDPSAAARTYLDAAVVALSRFANEEAQRLADIGLSLARDDRLRVALLDARGEARARAGDLTGAEADLRGVLIHTTNGPAWSRTAARLAWLVAGGRDYTEGLSLAEAAITAAGADEAARAHALAVAARIDMNLGDLGRCRERTRESLAIYERIGDAEGMAQVVDLQAIATFEEGELREAVTLFERAATLFTSRGALFRAVMPLATRTRALTLMGRHEDALADADRALSLARMLGYPEGECYARLQRAFPLVGLGNIDDASLEAEEAVTIAKRLAHREWLSAATAARATAREAAGDLAAAEADFRSALQLAEEMPIHTTIAASGLARVLAATGRAADASSFAGRAVAASEGNRGARHVALHARAEVASALGDPEGARLAGEALAEAEASGHNLTVERLRALANAPTTETARRSG